MIKTLKELYEYREMIYSLIQKELRGKYKGSVLGFLWSLLIPLFQLVIYTIVFSVFMRSGVDKFYIFLFVALVPWLFFNSCITGWRHLHHPAEKPGGKDLFSQDGAASSIYDQLLYQYAP